MYPRPVALGLALCDNAIIERDTNKVSLIGQFRQLRYAQFPATAIPFWAATVLAGAVGTGQVKIEVLDLESLDRVYSLEQMITLADRLIDYHLLIRIAHCIFPAPGWYNAQLLIDEEWIAQKRIRVLAAL